MKTLKITVFLMLVVSIFTACSSKTATDTNTQSNLTPEETVQSAFDALQQKDYDKFNQYLQDSNVTFIGGQASDSDKNILNELFVNFSYSIISSKIDGDKGTVNIKIENTDFSSVVEDLIKQSINDAISNNTDKDEDEKLFISLLSEANQSNNKVSSELELPLNNTGSGWKIQLNGSARNALLGNMGDILSK